MRTFMKSMRNLADRLVQAFLVEKVFLVVAVFVAVLLVVGTFFYVIMEKLSYLDSFFYSVMVITTVGASDFRPHTIAGKLFTTIYALIGSGFYVGLIAGLAQAIIIKEYKKEKK